MTTILKTLSNFDGGNLNSAQLIQIFIDNGLVHINKINVNPDLITNNVELIFSNVLSGGEQTLVDNLCTSYVYEVSPEQSSTPMIINNSLTITNLTDTSKKFVVNVSNVSAINTSTRLILNQSKNIILTMPNLTVGNTDTLVMENTQQIVQNKVFKDFVGSNTPTINVSGLSIFSEYKTGRRMLAQKDTNNFPYSFQPFFGGKKIGMWTATGISTTPSAFGIGNTTAGSLSFPFVNTALGMIGMTRVITYTTSSTNNQSAGVSHATAQFIIGSSTQGGFYYVVRFIVGSPAIVSSVSTQRLFIGLSNSASASFSNEPNAITNMIGFGVISSGSNMVFFHNNGGGTATSESLTGSFPAKSAYSITSPLYEARIYCPPGGPRIYYSLQNLNGGDYYESSVLTSDDCPSSTTVLCPRISTNNGSSTAAAISVISQYIETQF